MSSTELYLNKAKEYQNGFEKLIAEFIDIVGLEPQDPKYIEQQKNLDDLKMNTKLLFSEFENGQIFVDKIKEIDESKYNQSYDNKLLGEYKNTLDLFINHLKEFR